MRRHKKTQLAKFPKKSIVPCVGVVYVDFCCLVVHMDGEHVITALAWWRLVVVVVVVSMANQIAKKRMLVSA